ncbi:MAG TPA: type IV pilus modification protein PilV [Lamprocystis sp. (in: g-proteobacteria)]|nr:type IV pilus modification protein PilV [Lamprocystis sp. (in: g-proteobacteria)]
MVTVNRPETSRDDGVIGLTDGSFPHQSPPALSWPAPLNPPRQPTPIDRNRGFSLIEVLVAVLVVTVGLLGLAALQVSGLKVADSARFRTLASMAAYDVVDRIRANPTLISAGTEEIPRETCNSAVTASNAKTRWIKDFCAFRLPPPQAATNAANVVCDADGNCVITISWDDSRVDNNDRRGTRANGAGDKSFEVHTRVRL